MEIRGIKTAVPDGKVSTLLTVYIADSATVQRPRSKSPSRLLGSSLHGHRPKLGLLLRLAVVRPKWTVLRKHSARDMYIKIKQPSIVLR